MDAKEKSLINESLPTQEDSQLEPTASQDTEKQENSAQLHFLAAGQSQELQAHYQNLEQILRKRTQQRDVYKARYQALATELTKLKSQDQGFSQLDDSYLIQQVEGLRVKIWNFGLHHYGGVVSRGKSLLDPLLSDYTEFNMRSDMDLEYYLELPDWRPAIMEAFLWRLMVAEIFNRFWWAGSVGKSMSRLHRVMKQSNNPGFQSTADIQSFQTWSATTTKLILESQKRNGPLSSGSPERKLETLVKEIHGAIQQYRTSTRGGLMNAIREILNEAIALDEELCQQLAQFEWDFPGPEVDYDAQRMQLADGEAPGTDGLSISIVICPGIKKWGRSGDFEKEDSLVPIKVSCVAPVDRHREPSFLQNFSTRVHRAHCACSGYVKHYFTKIRRRNHGHSACYHLSIQNNDIYDALGESNQSARSRCPSFSGGVATRKIDILHLVKAADEKRKICIAKQWKLKVSSGKVVVLRDVLEKIAGWVDCFVVVGDTIIQYDPIHAALPWAAFCFLLNVAVSDVQA
ncbi:unnamed protein product [Penicillium manginii]